MAQDDWVNLRHYPLKRCCCRIGREGAYRLCLLKSDLVEGESLPADYKPEEIAYGWGRYEHT